MSEVLATTGGALINVPQKYDADILNQVSKSGDYLPRIQVAGGSSKLAKQRLVALGNYGIVYASNQVSDLGEQFDAIVIAWRPKAMRLPNDGTVLSYFKSDSPEFTQIMAESEGQDTGCFYGPEFLLYIPGLPNKNKFATMLLGSKSARKETPGVTSRLGNMATFKIRLAEQGKHSWHVPFAVPCSTSPANMPDPEELQKELDKFQNPKDSEVEVESQPAGAAGRER